MRTLPRRFLLLASAASVTLAACTLLLDRSSTQCATNGDCAHFRANAVCVAGFCEPPDAGPDAVSDAGPTLGDGGDAGSDAASCPPGCFSGTPSTDLEFFNACTHSSCVVFDNCTRLGLCDGAAPALISPPVPEAGVATEASVPTVPCYSASRPTTPLYMQGSTNFTPFIAAMSKLVTGNTIIWQPTSSCAGAAAGGFASTAMVNPTSSSQNPATFYDQSGNATPCALGNGIAEDPHAIDANSDPTDIGESDVFSEQCAPAGQSPWTAGTAAYPNIAEYLGPVQSFVFVTPTASDQTVISAEAARLVFGLGGDNGKSTPWTDPSSMLIRSPSTGTDIILSLAIDMPPTAWWGSVVKNAPAMTNDIIDTPASSAEATIGVLSTDYSDNPTYKTSVNTLYFQATGQKAGFLPDSLPSTNDKQNTRDGHYSPWGFIHLYLTLNTSVQPPQPQPQAQAFVSLFNEPNQALVQATILGGDVPVCAMHVTRTTEMGPLQTYAPSFQCNCFYDTSVNGGTPPATCTMCTGPSECPSQACNLGFCEAE
jgi:hypothetical protein